MTPLSETEAAIVARFEAAEPAPESWDGGLREAIAAGMRALRDGDPTGYHGRTPGQLADAVLALPEVAALRAKAAAADRVRELAEELPVNFWAAIATGPVDSAYRDGYDKACRDAAGRIRAALDGPRC